MKHLPLYIFLLFTTHCLGQSDVVLLEDEPLKDSISASPMDSSVIVVKERKHSPKVAGCLAMIPGLGQAYNKKYWKIPINYAGFAATGYFVYHFHSQYASYRDEYRNRLDGKTELLNPEWEHLHLDNINMQKQYHQQNMQISIMALAIWYFINILDAVVDAHLMSFDVSDNLSLHITPDFKTNPAYAKQAVGVSFTFNIK